MSNNHTHKYIYLIDKQQSRYNMIFKFNFQITQVFFTENLFSLHSPTINLTLHHITLTIIFRHLHYSFYIV